MIRTTCRCPLFYHNGGDDMNRIVIGGATTFVGLVGMIMLDAPSATAYGAHGTPVGYYHRVPATQVRYVYSYSSGHLVNLQARLRELCNRLHQLGHHRSAASGYVVTGGSKTPTSTRRTSQKRKTRARYVSFSETPQRIWVDKTMTNRVQARLISFDGSWVVLQTESGNRLGISIKGLSQFDRKYVRRETRD